MHSTCMRAARPKQPCHGPSERRSRAAGLDCRRRPWSSTMFKPPSPKVMPNKATRQPLTAGIKPEISPSRGKKVDLTAEAKAKAAQAAAVGGSLKLQTSGRTSPTTKSDPNRRSPSGTRTPSPTKVEGQPSDEAAKSRAGSPSTEKKHSTVEMQRNAALAFMEADVDGDRKVC